MLSPGLWLVEALNKLIPPQAMHDELDQAKLGDREFQDRDYAEAAQVCPQFGARWDLSGKAVLDVGSGLGGKAAYYAEEGAGSVTAIDLRAYSAGASLALASRRELASRIRPLVADAARMPFAGDNFDVIVSINVLEHVKDVRSTLAECKRVLHPDGLIFLYYPPFYSPWGAHVEGWIDFPWPHLFFSDKTLIEAASRVENRRRHNQAYISPARVDWEHLERLPDLNRVTMKESLQIIESLDLTIVESRMLPFAWQYLSRKGTLAKTALSVLKWLTHVRPFREWVTTKMAFVLAKRS